MAVDRRGGAGWCGAVHGRRRRELWRCVHRDRATDQTIAQIQTEGPQIVAQMLTYDPKSLREDFARARSLATDKYRGQLAAQQEVVEKGHRSSTSTGR